MLLIVLTGFSENIPLCALVAISKPNSNKLVFVSMYSLSPRNGDLSRKIKHKSNESN